MKSLVRESNSPNNSSHKLWKGQSGAIWFRAKNDFLVCIAPNESNMSVGDIIHNPTSLTWKPFYGTVELSE